jgi:hypothetical protein
MDGGVGEAAFMDEAVGNGWATQHPEKGRKPDRRKAAKLAG